MLIQHYLVYLNVKGDDTIHIIMWCDDAISFVWCYL